MTGFAISVALMVAAVMPSRALPSVLEPAPDIRTYLPLVVSDPARPQPGCPPAPGNAYTGGPVYQYDLDNPVRPAGTHADKNLALRSYTLNADPDIQRELVSYGTGDPIQPPQVATLFDPPMARRLTGFYRVHNWNWAVSPDPGIRGDAIVRPPVTALALATTPGEMLRVPSSGHDIGAGMEVVVLYADEDTIAFRYGREDSAGAAGYTVHIDGICTDPSLLALYDSLDRPDGPRYTYVPPEHRPYTYNLPTLRAGQPFGTARDVEIILAVVDSGAFMDPRSCGDWWRVRPGYSGTCPPAQG